MPRERELPESFGPAEKLIIWQTIAARRAGLDAMMWQTPALGMTAQAFLLTLALGSGVSRWARMLAGVLSLILAMIVMQLMAKHRRHEMLDSRLLADLESRFGIEQLLGLRPHASPDTRPSADVLAVEAALARSTPGPRWFWRMKSYEIWMVGLGAFAIVAVAIILTAAVGVGPQVFG